MKAAGDVVAEVSDGPDVPMHLVTGDVPTPPRTPSPAPFAKSKDHLSVPLLPPSRSATPDNASVLSADEWQRLNGKQSLRPSSWRTKIHAFWFRNLGLFYMLLAQIFGTAMIVATRYLEVYGNHGKGFHPFQVLWVRMGITTILASSYMWYNKTEGFPFGPKGLRLLLVGRGFAGFFGIFGMYYSLTVLPISDATVLTFLSPGLSLWVCSIFLGAMFSRIDMLGTIVSLVGVVFIAKPTSLISFLSEHQSTAHPHSPDAVMGSGSNSTVAAGHVADAAAQATPKQRVIAVGVAMVGVMGSVIVYTVLRAIGKRCHPLISVNYFGAWCTLVSTVVQIAVPSIGFAFPSNNFEWLLLILLGVCGFTMQFLLVLGLSYEKGSRATNMMYTSMLFALASDKIFFHISPSLSSIAGSTLILGAAIVMALQKAQPVSEAKPAATADADEERGLAEGAATEEEAMPLEEVPLRSLR